MTLYQEIRCNACSKSDCMLQENQTPIRHELRNWWLVGVKSKWNGQLLDFCPDCKEAGAEHFGKPNDS